jgi:hypothetical protein
MNWRKLNRILHRDIGYFFFGMSVIYGVSGIALNHIDDWDPSYHIRNEKTQVDPSMLGHGLTTLPGQTTAGGLTKEEAISILEAVNVSNRYKSHYFPTDNLLKIFVEGGSVTFNRISGKGIIEIISRRPVFYQFNFLHYNNPKLLWTWFADFYGAALVVMAITGLWMIQGKRGFYGRGKWYVIAGILIPVLFLLMYM